MASIGLNACRSSSGNRSAASTSAGMAWASRPSMRCAAACPSGTAFIVACAMFSAQPQAKDNSASRGVAPASAAAAANAVGHNGAPGSAASVASRGSSPCNPLRSQSSSERPICSDCARSSAVSRVWRSQSLTACRLCRARSRVPGDVLSAASAERASCARATAGRSERASASCSCASSQSPACCSLATSPASTADSMPSE